MPTAKLKSAESYAKTINQWGSISITEIEQIQINALEAAVVIVQSIYANPNRESGRPFTIDVQKAERALLTQIEELNK